MWWPEAGKEELNFIWSTARCCKEFQWKLAVRGINFPRKHADLCGRMEGGGSDTAHTDSSCLGQHWTTTAGSGKGYFEIKGWKANSMDNTHSVLVSLASGGRLTAVLLISLQGWSIEYLSKNKPLGTVILNYHFSHLPLCKSHRHCCPLNLLAGGKAAPGRSCGCPAPLTKIKGAQDTKQG